jgi:hypothetical protein
VGWKLVLSPVSGKECDRHAADVADVERRGGIPVRRLDGDLLHVVEEGVEAGASEDPDAGGGQAERSLALPEEDEEELSLLPEPELPEPELPEPEFPEPSEDDFPAPESDFFSEDDDLSEPAPSPLFFEPPSPEDFDRLSVE